MAISKVSSAGFDIPGVSAGVMMRGGELLLLSGHIGACADGGAPASLGGQLELAFANIEKTLTAAGATFSNVGRLTIYVLDYRLDMLGEIRAVRDRFVDADCPPASALIGVSALAFPELLVEVDAVAMI